MAKRASRVVKSAAGEYSYSDNVSTSRLPENL